MSYLSVDDSVTATVTAAVARARAAQQAIEGWNQQQVDDAVTAIAYAATRPDVVERLAILPPSRAVWATPQTKPPRSCARP